MNKREMDAHSVNCYDCGELVDERDCVNGDEYTHDGGSLCPHCLAARKAREVLNRISQPLTL